MYAYFDSKNAIYDAMFGQAAEEFASQMAEPHGSDDLREVLVRNGITVPVKGARHAQHHH